MFRAMKALTLGALAALVFSLGPVHPAGAGVSDWLESDHARVRLVAAGISADGIVQGALEIELAPGWKTYWRSPGDAGMAPVIDFSGSQGIGAPEVAFPPPHRYDDGFGISNVYTDRVVLPFTAKAATPGEGAELNVSIDIGVCEQICVPEHFDAVLSVSAGPDDPEAAAIVKEGRDAVPRPAERGVLWVSAASRDGGTDRKPVFRIEAVAPDPKATDLYVEAPADWYTGSAEFVFLDGKKGVWRVAFELPEGASASGTEIRVTMVTAEKAVEQTVPLE
jgi:DsbC/DsbD-like thiol-disulfide interchange protein